MKNLDFPGDEIRASSTYSKEIEPIDTEGQDLMTEGSNDEREIYAIFPQLKINGIIDDGLSSIHNSSNADKEYSFDNIHEIPLEAENNFNDSKIIKPSQKENSVDSIHNLSTHYKTKRITKTETNLKPKRSLSETFGLHFLRSLSKLDESIDIAYSRKQKNKRFWDKLKGSKNKIATMRRFEQAINEKKMAGYEKSKNDKKRLTIQPDTRLKRISNHFRAFLILYYVILVPMDPSNRPIISENLAYYLLIIADILFFISTLERCFFHSFYEGTILRTSIWDCYYNHFSTAGAYIYALFTQLPLFLLFGMRFRMVKLLTLLEIDLLESLLAALPTNITKQFLKPINYLKYKPFISTMVSLAMKIILILHIVTCVWDFMNYDLEGVSAKYDDSSYLSVFYFMLTTFSTVGYGDLYSTLDPAPLIMMIFLQILGVTFISLIIVVTRNAFKELYIIENAAEENYQEFNSWMTAREMTNNVEISHELSLKLRQMFRLYYNQNVQLAINSFDILTMLPNKIEETIKLSSTFWLINKLWCFFSDFSYKFSAELLLLTKWQYFKKGNVIIQRGEVPKGMYFIIEGSVFSYYLNHRYSVSTYEKGMDFGHNFLLKEKSRSAYE